MPGKLSTKFDFVPIDIVVNGVIASAMKCAIDHLVADNSLCYDSGDTGNSSETSSGEDFGTILFYLSCIINNLYVNMKI